MPNEVKLWWDGYTRLYIDLQPDFQGSVSGLCGTLSNSPLDDFETPDGDVENDLIQFGNQ